MIRNFLSALFKQQIEVDVQYTAKLEKIVKDIKNVLESSNVQVPFFIAGGSVYSIISCNDQYEDIDVFFYNREDCEKVTSNPDWTSKAAANTDNALTMVFHNVAQKIQFVKLHVGEINDVFKTFDFNCSKCAITSDMVIHNDMDSSDPIDVNLNMINGMVVDRYFKYTRKKKAQDPDDYTLKKIISYLVDTPDKKYKPSYLGEKERDSISILDSIINYDTRLTTIQFIHDCVANQQPQQRLRIFENLPNLIIHKVIEKCDEYLVHEILTEIKNDTVFNKTRYYDDNDKRVMEKYAEYFI